MDHLDLCSGIGGFAIAARWMCWKTVGFAEIDEFASKVLEKHWPGVPNYGDIRSVPDGTRADILTAGFPCQPYSCAGKQLGAEDDRAIWPLVIEVVRRVKPRWCVFENVAGIINMALDGVLSDLEAEGYEVGTLVLPACAVNAPHRRDRVWIVAHNAIMLDGECHAKQNNRQVQKFGICYRENALADSESDAWELRQSQREDLRNEPAIDGEKWIAARSESATAANPDRSRLERRDGRELRERADERAIGPAGSHAPHPDREPQGRATEPRDQRGGGQPEPGVGGVIDGLPGRLDGTWDGDWERGVPRVATGVKDRAKRLKALGNAIVPQVVHRIFESIAEADRASSQRGS